MESEEMIRILEEIIRNPDTNATARCTAIRTLREFPQQPEASVFADLDLYPDDFELRGKGRGGNNTAEQERTPGAPLHHAWVPLTPLTWGANRARTVA